MLRVNACPLFPFSRYKIQPKKEVLPSYMSAVFSALKGGAVVCSTVQYSSVQFSAVQCKAVQCRAVQYRAAQCSL